MSERVEISLCGSLAELFEEQLRRVLAAAGFSEAMHLASPRVIQYQRDGDLISLEVGHVPGHKEAIALESESLALDQYVARAALNTIVAVCDQVLAALPGVDREAAAREVEALLSRRLAPESGRQGHA